MAMYQISDAKLMDLALREERQKITDHLRTFGETYAACMSTYIPTESQIITLVKSLSEKEEEPE